MSKKPIQHFALNAITAAMFVTFANNVQAVPLTFLFERTDRFSTSHFFGRIETTGTYRIRVGGARGGDMFAGLPTGVTPGADKLRGSGGNGALFVADMFITAGDYYGGMVGENGRADFEHTSPYRYRSGLGGYPYPFPSPGSNSAILGGGGGGRSTLKITSDAGYELTKVVAGGGGGASWKEDGYDGRAEQMGGDGGSEPLRPGTANAGYLAIGGAVGGAGGTPMSSEAGGGAGTNVANSVIPSQIRYCNYGAIEGECNASGGGGGASIDFKGQDSTIVNGLFYSRSGQGGVNPEDVNYVTYATGDAFLFNHFFRDNPDYIGGKYGGHGGYGGGGGGYMGGGGGGGYTGGGGGGAIADIDDGYRGFGGGGGGSFYSKGTRAGISAHQLQNAAMTAGGSIIGGYVSIELLPSAVPLPGTLGLFGAGVGLIGLFGQRSRRRT
jgi:hypothetical protein